MPFRRLPFTFALLCAALLLTTGCGDDAKEKAKDIGRAIGEKAGGTWNSIRDFTAEKKDEAVAFFSKSKDSLAGQYEKAKEKSASWSEDAKAALDDKWKKVEETYGKAKDATGDGWATARDAFAEAYDAFKKELEKHSQ